MSHPRRPPTQLRGLLRGAAAHVPRRAAVRGARRPLVGRDAELAALRSDLETHRLVTLTGPAGVGKTRLAVEAARLTTCADGAWLIRLDTARAPADVAQTLADAVPGLDATDPVERLRGAGLLLVLDNCEHLAEAVAELAERLLVTAQGVRLLATSQRSLGVDGEQVRSLAPLRDPDSVALFAQRAAQRRPSFTLSAETARDVAQVCRALDNLPLAMELAAARTRVLTVPEIAARLDDRFTLLADPLSRGPRRSRTLAAALAWSYDLLFPDDQRSLWARAQFPRGRVPVPRWSTSWPP